MKLTGSGKKVANSLVAAGSAAVLAVYAAGYERTKSAADQLEEKSDQRRPAPVVVEAPRAAPAPVQIASAKIPEPVVAVTPTVVEPKKAEKPTEEIFVPPPPPVAATPVPVAAPPPPPPVVEHPAEPAPAAKTWKDGKYTGWGTSRHGDIQAEVTIEGGKILQATIADCRTRYSCDVIDRLPPQVAKRQSPDVDYVSGATQSANAFYYAVVDALSKAK